MSRTFALKSILSWEGRTFDNDDFTEALAGVMTLLLGRTVVIVADTFLNAAQEKIGETCATRSPRKSGTSITMYGN